MEMKPPDNWLKMIENIRKIRLKFPAPVDSMGCDQAHYQTDNATEQRFLVLVSLMLSSQTKDPVTWAAVQKLKRTGLVTPNKMVATKESDIEDLIHPVGFYRRKAIYLKQASQILIDHYNGDIPKSIEDLCKLPGVGPKMAHLCMQEAWNVVSGIGVDTHVHRISARLGWVPTKGIKTPEDTRKALEQWLPREYWREINHMLVGFGQTICTPVRPKCSECANSDLCPSSSIKVKGVTSSAETHVDDSGKGKSSKKAAAVGTSGDKTKQEEQGEESGVVTTKATQKDEIASNDDGTKVDVKGNNNYYYDDDNFEGSKEKQAPVSVLETSSDKHTSSSNATSTAPVATATKRTTKRPAVATKKPKEAMFDVPKLEPTRRSKRIRSSVATDE